MKILKLLLITVGVLVSSCVLAFGIAALALPASRSFENETEINAPAEKVWEVVTDVDRYVEWQTQIGQVEIIDDKNWVEYPKNTPEPLRFRVVNDERPRKMEFHYTMGDSFSGRWKGEVTETANGVTIKTIDSYATEGVLTRVMIGTFFDMDGFAKDWNASLKRRVESLNK